MDILGFIRKRTQEVVVNEVKSSWEETEAASRDKYVNSMLARTAQTNCTIEAGKTFTAEVPKELGDANANELRSEFAMRSGQNTPLLIRIVGSKAYFYATKTSALMPLPNETPYAANNNGAIPTNTAAD